LCASCPNRRRLIAQTRIGQAAPEGRPAQVERLGCRQAIAAGLGQRAEAVVPVAASAVTRLMSTVL
jgi:hypothetical protein